MHPQLSHLLVTHKAAELQREAELARLAKDAAASRAADRPESPFSRTLVRLRLRGAATTRLRIRRV